MQELLDLIIQNARDLVPEILLAAAIPIMLITGLLTRNNYVFGFTAIAIVAVAIILNLLNPGSPEGLFLSASPYSRSLIILVDFATILTLGMSMRAFHFKPEPGAEKDFGSWFSSEFIVLMLGLLLGCHVLILSDNLLMIFLGIETISISSYLLTGFRFNKESTEGGLKYFIFGSTISALMVYGMSLLYGFTGTLSLSSPEFTSGLASNTGILLTIAVLLTGAGLLFKLSAAPFHFWAPDVYESAPLPVVALISIVPKAAVISTFVRFSAATAIPAFDWAFLLGAIAIITLGVGNFAALKQIGIRRLMAYSSIAQSGFILIGLASGTVQGIWFTIFYTGVYLLATYILFYYIQFFEYETRTRIDSWQGLGSTFPLPMALCSLAFVSLVGIPPMPGFTGKLFLFTALWDAYSGTGKTILLILMIWGLFNAVVALFYYLRIPFFAYFRSPAEKKFEIYPLFETVVGLILVIGMLALFFQPGLLMGWFNNTNFAN